MPSPIVESFSITHAAILDGFSGADVADIYGVRSGSVEVDSDSYSNTGDDAIQSVWNWFNLATVTVESGYLSFDLLATIAASAITTSGTAPNDIYTIPLWNQKSLNAPPMPMLLRTAAKKADGSTGFLDFVLYKVQFGPIRFDGPSYKTGLTASFTGQALMSYKDELGATLADPAVGRLRYSTRSIIISPTAFTVVDNGDGTFTISGSGVSDNGDGTFIVSSSQLTDNGDGTYTLTY